MTDFGDAVIFAPHPDDEVIACAGAILNRVAAKRPVHICFSTDGSQSHKAVLGLDEPSPDSLAAIRETEATAAASVLGVPKERLTFVRARDTRLVDSLDLLRTAVDRLLSGLPHLAEVFIPHESRELNADHSLTGRIVLERLTAGAFTPRVYKYVVWDAEVEASFGFVNREADQTAAPAPEVLHREDITPHLETKYAALLQHKTQTALFTAAQTRTVVPPSLMDRVRTRAVEEFWTPA